MTAISVPQNPLAAMIGGGVMFMHVDPPSAGILDRYEVQLALAVSGPYHFYSNTNFSTNTGFIYGLPPNGINLYIQIRAWGADGSVSAWVQVVKGVLAKPDVTMTCTCVAGSIIPAGAMFAVTHPSGRMIGYKAKADINFTS